MDLRNLCSKIDMDAIRAKIPPLPQIKLPKSMSKLKSRKIFRSSREDVNSISRRSSSKRIPANSENIPLPLGPPYAIPPSGFINRTPTRISTISSLMNQRGGGGAGSKKWKSQNDDDDNENSYRSAGGIDDYYPSPLCQRFEQRLSRPISPVRAPPIAQEIQAQSEQNIKVSFGEKLQKSYKDVTELKFKHLFAKKTVLHTDKIEINEYIHRYDEERRRDEKIQEKLDRDIADNYRFQFKVSRQKSEESYIDDSPASSPHQQNVEPRKNRKNLSELSGDESGMESSPPTRKPGIAATRFARVRHTPLNMSLEEDNDYDDGINENVELNMVDIDTPKQKPKSSIYDIKKQKSLKEYGNDDDDDTDNNIELNVEDVDSPNFKPNTSSLYDTKKHKSPEKSRKSKSIRERMGRLTKQKSEGDENKVVSEKKRRAPLTPQQSEDNEADSSAAPSKSDKPYDAIKQNFKRIQKSIKLPPQLSTQSGVESENDESNSENRMKLSKTQQFTERLKRFRSTDNVDKNPEDNKINESPIHKIANKLQEWKKSIKKKVDPHSNDNEDVDMSHSPQKQPAGSLMKKLKHIRSRKHDSTDDPDDDEEGGETYKESLTARAKIQLEKGVVVASQMPQRTMKKISETKKYFKKKQENEVKNKTASPQYDEEDMEIDDQVKTSPKLVVKSMPSRPPPPIPRPFFRNSFEEEDDGDNKKFITKSVAESKLIAVPAATAVWTTKPILLDDTTDYDEELPRVLLHQDNSDVFESTLIIAVTRPISHATTPIITELPPDSAEESTPDTKPDNWIPNQDMVATFLEMTPPSQRKLSKDSNSTTNSRGHSRKHSIDSSSDDSWIKDIPRGPSTAVLNSVHENEEPWKIQKGNTDDKLYKTKSIDLFEMQKKHGGALSAFEDFDDELKNTPVVKIEKDKITSIDKEEKHKPLDLNVRRNVDNYDRGSSEEPENPDDDNSSRVTKIFVHSQEPKNNESAKMETELKSQPYGNSRESLTGNLDDKDAIDSGEEDDDEDSDDDDDDDDKYHEDGDEEDEVDLPPSKTPSPPPSTTSTPPPLPQRQPSIRLSTHNQSSLDLACPSVPPPPLPLTKPPIPPNRPTPPPPKIPDRNPLTARISKPLVKTASLRLAYSEQVNPQDVGKVNKLISRFEPEGPKQRPRVLPRNPLITNESEEYSDEEDLVELLPTKQREKFRDTTPTNHPRMQKSFSIDSVDIPNNNDTKTLNREIHTSLSRKATSQIIVDSSGSATPLPSISISPSSLDVNSNFSQPSSVYGSPLPYPSSLVGSTEVTPLTNRKGSEHLGTRRNRRSMARDDEHFYSFDSDEENSYYSISSNSSNRYVVDL